MNIEQARAISEKEIGDDITDIKQITFGGDSITYRIITNAKNYILRTGGKRSNYDVEHEVLRRLAERKVKVSPVVSDFIDIKNPELCFSLQEGLPGQDMFRLKLTTTARRKITEVVGHNLKIVHGLILPGFGPISPHKFRETGRLVGGFTSYFEFVSYYFHSRVDGFLEKFRLDKSENFINSQVSKKNLDKIMQIIDKIPVVERRMDILRGFKFEGSLCHGDLHEQHVFVHNGKLNGIIDFNNALVADPLFDIAYWSIMPKGDLYNILLKSSETKMDRERFRLYRMLISIAKINTRYVEHNYLNEFPEILDYALLELNR